MIVILAYVCMLQQPILCHTMSMRRKIKHWDQSGTFCCIQTINSVLPKIRHTHIKQCKYAHIATGHRRLSMPHAAPPHTPNPRVFTVSDNGCAPTTPSFCKSPTSLSVARYGSTSLVYATTRVCIALQLQSGDLHAAVEGQDGGARLPGAGI